MRKIQPGKIFCFGEGEIVWQVVGADREGVLLEGGVWGGGGGYEICSCAANW